MVQFATRIGVLAACGLTVPLAHAATLPVYFGAGGGKSTVRDFSADDFDDSSFTQSSDEDSTTPSRIFFGASLLENLSIEAGWISPVGEARMDAQSNGCCFYGAPGPVHYEAAIDGIDLAVIGKLPLTGSFHIGGKLGALMWDLNEKISYQIPAVGGGTRTYTESGTDDGTELFVGFLAQYDWARVALRGELTRYTVDNADVDVVSASLLFWFRPGGAEGP